MCLSACLVYFWIWLWLIDHRNYCKSEAEVLRTHCLLWTRKWKKTELMCRSRSEINSVSAQGCQYPIRGCQYPYPASLCPVLDQLASRGTYGQQGKAKSDMAETLLEKRWFHFWCAVASTIEFLLLQARISCIAGDMMVLLPVHTGSGISESPVTSLQCQASTLPPLPVLSILSPISFVLSPSFFFSRRDPKWLTLFSFPPFYSQNNLRTRLGQKCVARPRSPNTLPWQNGDWNLGFPNPCLKL